MARRMILVTVCAFGALAAGGCGSSTSVATGAATSVVPSGSTTAAGAPATTAGAATGPGTTLFAAGIVPAVTGGADLTKEPVVAAGSPTPPTVLTGHDLVVGTGKTAAASNTVEVQYVGALYSTGKVFDASWTDNGPTSFPLNGVIVGFKDAIIGMKVGGRREIVIPPALGYGAAGQPPTIPGNATLVFVIDLLGVS